jgi:hypothetical protein
VETLTLDQINAHNGKFAEIIARAKTDPLFNAIYRVWLIATDTDNDASRAEMDQALTEIDRITGIALGVRK